MTAMVVVSRLLLLLLLLHLQLLALPSGSQLRRRGMEASSGFLVGDRASVAAAVRQR